MSASRNVALVDADIAGFGVGTLRFRDRILSVGEPPEPGDRIVEVRGERLLPGLINAHDHLHRNHYPPLRFRERYDNASEWAADIDSRRRDDAVLTRGARVPLMARLLRGGLKNLLSGATTVVHHDVRFAELAAADFPVHVPEHGWAHSLALDGALGVLRSHRGTPADKPWLIHAGEGVDEETAFEVAVLDALQVLTPNSVLVHGLAFDAAARARLIERRVGLVWCPASNHFLYGRADVPVDMACAGLLALGSDSRLSGARDLLDELRFARELAGGELPLEALVTQNPARLLRLADRGVLRAGAVADFIVLPRDARLGEVRRADLRCVVARGEMRCGDQDYAELLLEPSARVPVKVDGASKMFASTLADSLPGEPGVVLPGDAAWAA